MSVFTAALERMHSRGWCKRQRWNNIGKSCMLGLFETHPGGQLAEDNHPDELFMLSQLIKEKYPIRVKESCYVDSKSPGSIICGFNDHAITTQSECRSLLMDLEFSLSIDDT